MTIQSDADIIADRRRLRRKLSFWRVTGIAALVVALGVAGAAVTRGSSDFMQQDQIARISVNNVIVGSQRMDDLFERAASSPAVKGVIINVNSPGGTATGSERLYRGIRALAEKKPVVTFVNGTAASGGYITAIASDYIVARETAVVGSIGAIIQYHDISGLLDKIGVKIEDVKSSPLKAEPSGYRPISPEAREALQKGVADTYAWFKDLVAARRHLNASELAAVDDGSVFSGRQGLSLKLVDKLGDEKDAIAWLKTRKGVPENLPVRDWKPKSDDSFSFLTTLALGADLLGYEKVADNFRRAGQKAEASSLDGLLALWQPSLEN